MVSYLLYQYPFEPWQTITSVNGGELTYSITQQQGQCCDAIYQLNYYADIRRCLRHELHQEWNPAGIYAYRYLPRGKVVSDVFMDIDNADGGLSLFIETEDCEGIKTRTRLRHLGSGAIAISGGCYTEDDFDPNAYRVALGASSYRLDSVVRRDELPDDCGSYTFKVFEGGVEIFTRTDQYQPQVNMGSIGECPENTCAVDCGSYVCCYNSQGISIFNYLK